MNIWKRKIKNTSSIANTLGVEEEKIKELVKGEREIEGKTLDKVLQAVEEDKINMPMKKLEILQWYKDTDLRALREKFGYKSQSEVARIIGCHNSTICNFENKVIETPEVGKRLIQLYNFYQNDFNRKAHRNNKKQNIIEKQENITQDNNKIGSNEEILKWYDKTDIKRLRGEKSGISIAKEIGIAPSSYFDVENKRSQSGRINTNLIKVYNYFLDNKLNLSADEDREIWNWYRNTDLKELRTNLGITQNQLSKKVKCSQPCVGDVELKRVKCVSPTMRKMYDYYKEQNLIKNDNQTKTLNTWAVAVEDKIEDEIENEESNYDAEVINESNLTRCLTNENEDSTTKLQLENQELKDIIKCFTKLIDKL